MLVTCLDTYLLFLLLKGLLGNWLGLLSRA